MRYFLWLVPISIAALPALGQQYWKDKEVSAWTEADARQVLSNSPWAQTVTPKMERSSGNQRAPRGGGGGGMGRSGGNIGMGGGNIGLGGQRGGNRAGGSVPRVDRQIPPPNIETNPRQPTQTPARRAPTLRVRWDSALPVRQAALKLRESGADSADDAHYAIAVLGVPTRMVADAKPKAELKRKGQKGIKASDVKIIPHEKARMIVFLFPKTKEITAGDKQVDFEARIGTLDVKQVFVLSEMTYAGKLEL